MLHQQSNKQCGEEIWIEGLYLFSLVLSPCGTILSKDITWDVLPIGFTVWGRQCCSSVQWAHLSKNVLPKKASNVKNMQQPKLKNVNLFLRKITFESMIIARFDKSAYDKNLAWCSSGSVTIISDFLAILCAENNGGHQAWSRKSTDEPRTRTAEWWHTPILACSCGFRWLFCRLLSDIGNWWTHCPLPNCGLYWQNISPLASNLSLKGLFVKW